MRAWIETMQEFDKTKYPNLVKLDEKVAELLLTDRARSWSTARTEYEISKIHPVYFLEQYGYIRPGRIELGSGSDAPTGGVIPFKLNSVQLQIVNRICAHYTGEQFTRVQKIILKHRKAGISTLIAGLDYWHMRFNPNLNAFVIADLSSHTDNIIEMIRTFQKHDKCAESDDNANHRPPGTIPMPKNKSGVRLSNGSMAEQDSGENPNPGTSGTIIVLHCSENAKWRPGAQVDAETSLLNSIPRTGYAFIIKESTAYGINKFAKDCEEASEGKSAWDFIFITWLDMADCEDVIYDGEAIIPTNEEKELMATYPRMTLGHIKFRRRQIETLGSVDKFKQDFPLNAREPFLITGSNYFNTALVEDRIDEIKFYRDWKRSGMEGVKSRYPEMVLKVKHHPRGEAVALSRLERDCCTPDTVTIHLNIHRGEERITFIKEPDKRLSDGAALMFRKPRKGGVYLVVIDVAEGKGQDNSIVNVLDTYKCEQVLEWGGNFDEEVAAEYGVMIARLYNQALIVFDMGNKCGGLLWGELQKLRYKNFFYRTSLSHNVTKREPGWETRAGMKKDIYGQFKLDFKNGDCLIHSLALLDEMMFFVDKQGKLEAAEGHKDDRVSTMAIGQKIRSITPLLRAPVKGANDALPTQVGSVGSASLMGGSPKSRRDVIRRYM